MDVPWTILYRFERTARHAPTGRTRHSVNGAPMPVPSELRIVRHGEEVYLFYCDSSGTETTDTLHDSVEGAMAQAEFEFRVRPDEWTRLDGA